MTPGVWSAYVYLWLHDNFQVGTTFLRGAVRVDLYQHTDWDLVQGFLYQIKILMKCIKHQIKGCNSTFHRQLQQNINNFFYRPKSSKRSVLQTQVCKYRSTWEPCCKWFETCNSTKGYNLLLHMVRNLENGQLMLHMVWNLMGDEIMLHMV